MTVEAAWTLIAQQASLACEGRQPETVPLGVALGRTLCEAFISELPSPRFSQSAMDGYGLALPPTGPKSELMKGTVWPVVYEVQAGAYWPGPVPEGSAVRIFTGAPLPEGVNAVVMQEDTQWDNETKSMTLRDEVSFGENIREAGEEFLAGVPLLPAGTRITPPVVALLASQGVVSVSVYPWPKIALLTTGNELVQPGLGMPLAPGQIYDSNGPGLTAALSSLGWPESHIRMVSAVADTETATREAFQQALDWADVVISLGGVSVGAYDLVQDVMLALGVEKVFWRLAAKPGKPVFFGARPRQSQPRQLVWGLPGNPVAAMVTFHELVKPALLRLVGEAEQNTTPVLKASLKIALQKKPGRMEWVRGKLAAQPDGTMSVTPTTGQDSHMLSGLALADCLIRFETEASQLPEGALVQIIPLNWRG